MAEDWHSRGSEVKDTTGKEASLQNRERRYSNVLSVKPDIAMFEKGKTVSLFLL